jgi:hypothetical protein
MAKAARSAVVAMMAAGALIGGSRATAAETADADVVLHVTSYERIPAAEMAAAQQAVVQVYGRIGVRIAWAGGVAAEATADGARHVDVIFLTAAMADRKQPNASAFGQASHVTGRAYIYPARILAHASRTSSDPELVLGLVLAHEIGHVLLPEYSHTPSGLMRAQWQGRLVAIPGFLPEQAATIRTLIAARN